MSVVAFTETKYQYDVIANCADLTPDVIFHWSVRDFLEPTKKNVIEVPKILHFIIKGLLAIPCNKTIIIGDFRSFSQYLFILYSLILRKNIVLSEDGLFSHIADLYNFQSYVFDDGGVRRCKKPFFKILRKRLNGFDRITTQPKFLLNLNKPISIYNSRLVGDDAGSTLSHVLKCNQTIIFVGQPLNILGIDENAFYEKLDQYYFEFIEKYSKLIYSLHPKEDVNLAASMLTKWNVERRSVDEFRENGEAFDIVGINSTVLIDERNSCNQTFYFDISKLEFINGKRKKPQMLVQKTLLEIAKSKNVQMLRVN